MELSQHQRVGVSRTLEAMDVFQELHGWTRAFLERSTLWCGKFDYLNGSRCP